jgi:hypothetical protein
MWKHVLNTVLVVLIFAMIMFVYKLNITQIKKKNLMVETFIQKATASAKDEPLPFTKDEFKVYANIIGIFKHRLNKEPTEDELFACYNKLTNKEMSLSELDSLLQDEHKNYRLFLFPEAKNVLAETKDTTTAQTQPTDGDDEEEQQDDDKTSSLEANADDDDNEKSVLDGNNRVQYIINRPTIYNIGTNATKSFESLNNNDVGQSTQDLIDAIRKQTDTTDDDVDNFTTFDQVEKNKNYKNRCQTEEELADQNKLAIKKDERNMNELKYGCDRSKKSDKLAHEYDDMVLRHDQLWRMPERYPPVCKMNSKKKCPINPVEVQSALLGTLLDDATNTKIGSIMPPFKYKE